MATRTNQVVLQEANPSKIDATFNVVGLGKAFGNIPRHVRGTLQTATSFSLPDNAKCLAVLAAYATAGTATGAKAPTTGTPAVGEVGVSPTGNILFNGTDAVTDAEIAYVAVEGDLVEAQMTVAADGTTQLPGDRSAVLLISASLDDNTSAPGSKTVVARGGAPAVGEAALSNDGQIIFNGTDVGASPGTATVKYIEWATTVSDQLNAESNQ